jgi:hypothetical protein
MRRAQQRIGDEQFRAEPFRFIKSLTRESLREFGIRDVTG